jgi:RNA polymerase sigma-32 factor
MIDNLKDRDKPMEEVVENRQMSFLLQDILSVFKNILDRRELDILERRIVSEQPCTLQKLGDKYGVSRERIRQIQGKITAKLRDFMRNRIPDFQTYHVN